MPKLYKAIVKSLKVPQYLKREGLIPKTFVTFVVTENGKVEQFQMLKGAPEIAQQMGQKVLHSSWQAARCNGQPVATKVVLPLVICF
ncbi:energy transducer TonB [Persicobacter psychrovividus]|uniref:TonB C-terminal domain-containing protein n=1 Tax=Persicobacter psychrovividus TaxID=387638 RepID=A0ABM7VIA0_9BACT|nr:hypothetical protein PEPS_29790 [Persicobacter psychrovividus]